MQTISNRDLQINPAIFTKDMKNMDGFLWLSFPIVQHSLYY